MAQTAEVAAEVVVEAQHLGLTVREQHLSQVAAEAAEAVARVERVVAADIAGLVAVQEWVVGVYERPLVTLGPV